MQGDHSKPQPQLRSSIIPNSQTLQQSQSEKCDFNLSPTSEHSVHFKSVSSHSSPLINSNNRDILYLSANRQQDISDNLSSAFLSKQTDHSKPQPQLRSSIIHLLNQNILN
ncbi:hypothetical protein M9Y10_024753 [Tritrichomonas musculus]|uniref:Uncharacterized protein n=1 Tax=Tritrichomonas musculus TaxID=1915356 RepID=A0ABR2HD26_9EUKA